MNRFFNFVAVLVVALVTVQAQAALSMFTDMGDLEVGYGSYTNGGQVSLQAEIRSDIWRINDVYVSVNKDPNMKGEDHPGGMTVTASFYGVFTPFELKKERNSGSLNIERPGYQVNEYVGLNQYPLYSEKGDIPVPTGEWVSSGYANVTLSPFVVLNANASFGSYNEESFYYTVTWNGYSPSEALGSLSIEPLSISAPSSVPEPASLGLLIPLGLLLKRRR